MHGSRSVCIDPEVKRSKVKVTQLSAWVCMSICLHMCLANDDDVDAGTSYLACMAAE